MPNNSPFESHPADAFGASPRVLQRSTTVPAEQLREVVREVADAWGALWDSEQKEGGELVLPLMAGLRRGRLMGSLRIESDGRGSRLVLEETSRTYRLQKSAVVVLSISAAGAITAMLWPFFPDLLPVAGVGAVLGLLGWFLIISRLATNGPEDFLDLVIESLETGAGEERE